LVQNADGKKLAHTKIVMFWGLREKNATRTQKKKSKNLWARTSQKTIGELKKGKIAVMREHAQAEG